MLASGEIRRPRKESHQHEALHIEKALVRRDALDYLREAYVRFARKGISPTLWPCPRNMPRFAPDSAVYTLGIVKFHR
jgi:hypothetical protein